MDIKPGNIFRQIENHSCVYEIGYLKLVCPHTETVFDDGYCRYIVRKLIESITNKDDDLRLADVFSLGKPQQETSWIQNFVVIPFLHSGQTIESVSLSTSISSAPKFKCAWLHLQCRKPTQNQCQYQVLVS